MSVGGVCFLVLEFETRETEVQDLGQYLLTRLLDTRELSEGVVCLWAG